jgi:TP901 family phage tail tape measure protein
MQPAAVLSVLVTAEGVGPTNARLNSVQSTLRKTAVAGDAAGSSAARAGAKMEKAGAGISRLGKAATKYVATPLLAAAGASVYFAQKYEKAMLMVQTHTDTNRRDLALYKREILEMGSSGKYVQGPAELGEAMYHIASDGYKGVKATTMLKKSADLAMVGQSDLAESTYALVSAMKTQIRGTESSGAAINNLNAIVGAGDMKMQEMVGAMSTGILPAAKAMGLSLRDVGVSLDIMTQRGVPAQQAAYRLAMTFQMLIPHTEKAEDAFKKIGLTNMSLIKAMEAHPKEGLLAALVLLKKHLDNVDGHKSVNQIQDIEEIFGGGRTSRGAITLLQNLDSVRETYGRINQLAGETPKKINEAKAAPVNRLKESLVQVETVMTELGSDIIPPLAEGITWIAHEVQHLAHWFHSLSPAAQSSIMKILALTIAIAFLIRIIGFFVKSFGMLISWFAKTTVATEEVILANEAAAVSYEETAVAAEASAAAQTAAIEEVAAAQKIAQAAMVMGTPIGWKQGQQSMGQMLPYAEEGGQMSLFAAGSRASMASEATVAAEEAGAAAGPAFAGGMALALPLAIGAIGLGNIITSVAGHDFKNAGQELGGALAGGLAGFMIGGPLGAIVGAGIGSVGADVIRDAHLFGTAKAPTKFQSRMSASHRHVKATHSEERGDFAKVSAAEKRLAGMKDKDIKANRGLVKAEHALKQARQNAGPNSHKVVKAELDVWKAKSKVIAKTEEQGRLERKHGFALLAAKHKAVEAVAASKIEIRNLKDYENRLLNVLTKEKEHGAFRHQLSEQTEKHIQTLEQVEKRYGQAKKRELKSVEEAEKFVGSKFAKGLANMNIAQARFGKHYEGLRRTIEMNPIKMHEIEFQHTMNNFKHGFLLPFQKQSHEASRNSAQSFKNWEATTNTAMGSVGGEMNKMLKAMGAKPLSFSAQSEKHKEAKKARGGMINVGAPEGDSVHALLEKGEYVVNREAVAKVGVHKLNDLNFGKAPRGLESGGPVLSGMGTHRDYRGLSGDTDFAVQLGYALSKMATGTGMHIDVLSGWRSIAEQAGLYQAYQNGTGNLAAPPSPNAPHVRGGAADIAPGRSTFGGMASKFGMGFTVPSEDWHIELLNAIVGAKGAFGLGGNPQLAKMKLDGPQGKLLKIGQDALNQVQHAAQEYINKSGSHGVAGMSVAVGPVEQMAKQMVSQIWGGGEWNSFDALEMSEAGWNPQALNPSSGAAGLAQALPPSKYPPGAWPYAGPKSAQLQLEWMMGYIKDRYGTPSAAWDFHQANNYYQQGGPVEAMMKSGGSPGKEGKPASIEKSIKSTLEGIGEGKHLPKFNSHLKKIGRRVSKIDLPHSQMNSLGHMTNEAEKFSEYASNASALTKSDEDGNITQGIFKGGKEGDWLGQELTALINLRKQIVGSHEVVLTKTLPHIMKLLKHTQKRLREAQKAIREDEEKKRELKKKIQDLEKVHNDNVKKLEKEKNSLENDLNKAQGAKTPDSKLINRIRDEIKSKNEAIGSDKDEANKAIKSDNEKIRKIEDDVHDKQRIEAASKTLAGQLGERRTSLYSTASDLYGQGGEFEGTGLAFYGLEQVQGKGGTTGDIPNPPELGSVGGEIFMVQNRLQEIQEELAKKPVSSADESSSELSEIEKEIALEWKQRYAVSQAQFKVLSEFPSVGSLVSVPHVGAYATGGLVAATVGERGKEVAVMPTGSRVVPEHDAKDAIARMAPGGGGFKIDHLHLYPDGSVEAEAYGKQFKTEVKKVTKEQGSGRKSPGGKW